jgi:type IV pilus assembly protein PilC
MIETLSKPGEVEQAPVPRAAFSSASGKRPRKGLRFRSSRLYLLMLFARQFATLVRAGVPISSSLANLAGQSDDPAFSLLLGNVGVDLRKGHSFSSALSRYPTIFDATFVSIIRAGEISGKLPEMMEKLAYLLEREFSLQRKVLSSLTYPATILVVMIAATLVLTQYIFPKFISAIGTAIAMPWPTKLLLFLTGLAANPYFWILCIAAALYGYWALRRIQKQPDGRLRIEKKLFALPIIGKALKKIALARFCYNLAVLLDCGLSIVRSMELAGDATGSATVANLVEKIKSVVKQGKLVSFCFSQERFFPPLMSQVLSVGEKTGEYARVLRTLARFFEVDADGALETIVNMLEPVGIVSMGFVVGFVLVATFWPLLQITTAL